MQSQVILLKIVRRPDTIPVSRIQITQFKLTAGEFSRPGKRIIKGRPFRVGFDRSHQRLQQGAPS